MDILGLFIGVWVLSSGVYLLVAHVLDQRRARMTQWNPMNEAVRQAAGSEMKKGVAWFAGAAALTVITYAAADPGGSYVLFWGAMAYGTYRLLRGFYYWANPNALLKKMERS